MDGIKYKGEAYIKASDVEIMLNQAHKDGYKTAAKFCVKTCEQHGYRNASDAIKGAKHELHIIKTVVS